MKKIFSAAAIIIALVSCDTSNGVIGNPDNNANTSGTTGSANMTNASSYDSSAHNLPGTGSDTAGRKKDSLPH